MAEVQAGDNYDEDNEDEEQTRRIQGTYYEEQALKAAAKGNLEDLEDAFDKKPSSILGMDDKNKKKWTPLVWAASKNQIKIFKYLVDKGALNMYLEVDEVQFPNKCTLGVINSQVKPTPLQWACFQGNLQIVWLLLKKNCRWEDVDQFGNNCVHLAASSSNLKVFQSLLMYGVETDGRNSRNHSVLDLATNKDIINLINIHMEAKECATSQVKFSYTNGIKKHWCQTCNQIFCQDQFKIQWTWETHESEEKERIDGKCLNCWDNIITHTQELEQKMQLYQYDGLTAKIEEIDSNNIEIDLKLLHKAKELQEQLRTQNQIRDKIDNLKVIKNYKTIFKSVHLLKEIQSDAEKRGVKIDQDVLNLLHSECERLNAERKLRFDLDNMNIGGCSPDDKTELSQSIDIAREKNVANNYLLEAEDMRDKMEKSLDATEIYRLFIDYKTLPEEEYPKCFYMDKKTGKVMDPETKKPADSKRFPPPKKKKKKKGDLKLVIPDWAAESPDQLDEKIKTLSKLLESAEDCKFEKQFIEDCHKEIKRMQIEWKYRVALQEELRLVAEWKLAQKKKK